jgi:hypothetical protein
MAIAWQSLGNRFAVAGNHFDIALILLHKHSATDFNRSTICLQLHRDFIALELHSLCNRSAIALQPLCNRFAVATISLHNRFTIAITAIRLQLLRNRFTTDRFRVSIALPSLEIALRSLAFVLDSLCKRLESNCDHRGLRNTIVL